jgi:Tfp pilus assembly protein PilP
MAGTAKSVYLTISKKGAFKTEFTKKISNAKDYNAYFKPDEFKAKWPKEEYDIVKEVY